MAAEWLGAVRRLVLAVLRAFAHEIRSRVEQRVRKRARGAPTDGGGRSSSASATAAPSEDAKCTTIGGETNVTPQTEGTSRALGAPPDDASIDNPISTTIGEKRQHVAPDGDAPTAQALEGGDGAPIVEATAQFVCATPASPAPTEAPVSPALTETPADPESGARASADDSAAGRQAKDSDGEREGPSGDADDGNLLSHTPNHDGSEQAVVPGAPIATAGESTVPSGHEINAASLSPASPGSPLPAPPLRPSQTGDLSLGAPPGGEQPLPSAEPPTPRRIRRYRPAKQVPPVHSAKPSSRSARSLDAVARPVRTSAFPIDVRVLFERGGFLRVSLLPQREVDLPATISASGIDLVSLDDDWYQDVAPSDLGDLLQQGIEWSARVNDKTVRWSLAGRDIYILARHDRLNGFLSTPRLTLNEPHVVLCAASRLEDAERSLAAAGCSQPRKVGEAMGSPAGWVALINVIPTRPVPPTNEGNILDVLCPRADMEIVLEGGIRIDRAAWLYGFPPTVRVRGDVASAGALYIDGKEAVRDASNHFTAEGWDARGEHRIWCHGMTCSYEIRDGAEAWEPWDAYVWSLGEIDSVERRRPAVCGMLVRPPPAAPAGTRSITVPASNLILVGAAPGEIEFCTGRRDLRASTCAVFPSFDPVWALPSDLRRCDNRTARIVLLRRSPPAINARGTNPFDWCQAILAASRKGLRTQPDDRETGRLWELYREGARSLRRRRYA